MHSFVLQENIKSSESTTVGKNDVVTDDAEIQNDDGVGDTLVDESTEVEYHCPVCSKVFDKVILIRLKIIFVLLFQNIIFQIHEYILN